MCKVLYKKQNLMRHSSITNLKSNKGDSVSRAHMRCSKWAQNRAPVSGWSETSRCAGRDKTYTGSEGTEEFLAFERWEKTKESTWGREGPGIFEIQGQVLTK